MNNVDEYLEHYGIKGMKWGVRRPVGKNGRVKKSALPKASELSDQELREAVNRMNLEKQYNALAGTKQKSLGKSFLKGAGRMGVNIAQQQAQAAVSRQVGSAIQKKFG